MTDRKMDWRTRLLETAGSDAEFPSLATPTYRGSTVCFATQQEVRDGWQAHAEGYSYGLYGTPTALELAARIARLEGAHHTFLVQSGQAAIALIYLSLCRPGDHVLLPWSAYGPSKELGAGLLRNLNVEVEHYDPLLGGGIAALLRENTALVWCENPGSITMEVQDVPAIVAAAHARGVPVALDNTYASGVLFDAFAYGIDISMQALTKYIGGHSDLLLGSVSVRTAEHYHRIGDTHRALGMHASPDDCALALRGMITLAVRLDAAAASALHIAQWFAARPEIATVLHPALPSCPGHACFERDFTGAASLFSVVFQPRVPQAQVFAFVNALQVFRIGWSWGGVHSLVMAYPGLERPRSIGGELVRFHIGLENTADLLADIGQALEISARMR